MNKRFHKNPLARGVGLAYLSPSDTRRLSIDMPIGAPDGGAANGNQDMPVVVVALAAGSFAAGAAAVAAATTLVATVAAGALMVGSALTIAGTLTGNKKLARIGGYISLAGGVASLANGLAGGAAGASAGAENVAPVLGEGAVDAAGGALADAAADAGSNAITGVAGDAAASTAGATGGGGLIDAATQGAADATTAVGTKAAETTAGAAATGTQAAANEAATQAATTPFTTGNSTAFTPGGTTNAFTTPAADTGNGLLGSIEQFDHTASFMPEAQQTGIQGYFDKAGQWVKNNKELVKVGSDVIGGVAKGLIPSDQEKAQTALLKQRTEQERIKQLWRQGRIA